MKKLISLLLVLCMVLGMSVSVFADDTRSISLDTGSYTIDDEGSYLVSQYTGSNNLIIKANATVTLGNVTINAAEETSAISIESGNVTLIIQGDNTLKGGKNGAGIYVAKDANLIIQSIDGGQLTAIGNNGNDSSGGAAGIGGTMKEGYSGAITIDGATVIAKGYGTHGSGIGSGSGISKTITIKNNSNVTAYGGHYSNGGKLPEKDKYGDSLPEGSAAIGGGGKTSGTIKPIIIEESKVNAYGGSKAAGIGATFWTSCDLIQIKDSIVHAEGGVSSAGIGTSRAGKNGVSAKIDIINSDIDAIGGYHGAGIGGGYNGDSLKNLPQTIISISGGKITAKGQNGGAGIGGGYKTNNLNITISGDAEVTAIASNLNDGSNKTIDQTASCAIGSGANGSRKFEGSVVSIASTAKVITESYAGGKTAIEDAENNVGSGAVMKKYIARAEQYILNLDYNGGLDEDGFRGIGLSSTTETYQLESLPTVERDGYTFEGWYNGEQKIKGTTVELQKGRVTDIYAQWNDNSNTTTPSQPPVVDPIIPDDTDDDWYYEEIEEDDDTESLVVRIKFDGADEADFEEIKVNLLKNGKKYDSEELSASKVSKKDWRFEWDNLDEDDDWSVALAAELEGYDAEVVNLRGNYWTITLTSAEVEAPVVSLDKANPDTGASDFGGAAVALAVVSSIGAVALNKRR